MTVVLWILIAQAILGGLDVLINHEWKEGLAYRQSARLEEAIHGLREILYAIVFIGLAWFAWYGSLAWIFAAILCVEIVLTGWDFVEEDRTRILSPTERLMHLALSMGGGAYCALLLPVLYQWSTMPTTLVHVDYGIASWLLSLFGVGVFGWGLRDLLAASSLYLQSAPQRASTPMEVI